MISVALHIVIRNPAGKVFRMSNKIESAALLYPIHKNTCKYTLCGDFYINSSSYLLTINEKFISRQELVLVLFVLEVLKVSSTHNS